MHCPSMWIQSIDSQSLFIVVDSRLEVTDFGRLETLFEPEPHVLERSSFENFVWRWKLIDAQTLGRDLDFFFDGVWVHAFFFLGR